MRSPQEEEGTFVVFRVRGLRIGIDADAISSVTSEEPAQRGDAAARLIVLRGQKEMPETRLSVRGAIQVVTLPRAQISPLPSLCASTRGVITAVAHTDEKVDFLIVVPHRTIDLISGRFESADEKEFR